MQYEITQWKQSNYVITLIPNQNDLDSAKNKVLLSFQKEMDMQGFRKGHVPLDMVEKNAKPMMLQMGIYEQVVHEWTKIMLDENKDKKFIWMIYDLQPLEKDSIVTFSFKLDVYPDVSENNKNRSSVSVSSYDANPSEEEIEQTITNLKKQYAQYEETDEVQEWTIFKAKFSILDKDLWEVDNGSIFLGKEDVEEFPILKTLFYGKKLNQEFEVAYDKKSLPVMLQVKKGEDDSSATTIKITIIDVRTVVLPEFTDENIKKFFWWAEVKSEEDLKNQIIWAITKQKEESLLMWNIDSYLTEIKESFDSKIPKTLIDEELKSRLKSMSERFWWEEWLKKYFEKLWEEESNKVQSEIKDAAKSSLEKFFLLRKIVENLWLTVNESDWNTPFSVEKKLYDHFHGG